MVVELVEGLNVRTRRGGTVGVGSINSSVGGSTAASVVCDCSSAAIAVRVVVCAVGSQQHAPRPPCTTTPQTKAATVATHAITVHRVLRSHTQGLAIRAQPLQHGGSEPRDVEDSRFIVSAVVVPCNRSPAEARGVVERNGTITWMLHPNQGELSPRARLGEGLERMRTNFALPAICRERAVRCIVEPHPESHVRRDAPAGVPLSFDRR